MKVRITHLKAPWPKGAKVGDEVDLEQDAIPAWAVGKCVPVNAAPAAAAQDPDLAAQIADLQATVQAQAMELESARAGKAEAERSAAAQIADLQAKLEAASKKK